jgi:hypothetical protein
VEGITLERPPGANGAAWGDIDVRAHQRAHRYLPTSLHHRIVGRGGSFGEGDFGLPISDRFRQFSDIPALDLAW